MSVKNKLLKSFVDKKASILKEEFHANYKKYRNLLSTHRGGSRDFEKWGTTMVGRQRKF